MRCTLAGTLVWYIVEQLAQRGAIGCDRFGVAAPKLVDQHDGQVDADVRVGGCGDVPYLCLVGAISRPPDFMTFSAITDVLTDRFGTDVFTINSQAIQPFLTIPVERLVELCQFLRDDDRLFFDLLACVTAIDNGPDANTMEVIYNLTSIPYEHDLMVKVMVPRNPVGNKLPSVPSLSHLWRTADWHEREAYDLIGIWFENHPDLRRILMPADWIGHPLRKDYQEETQYHGIQTK